MNEIERMQDNLTLLRRSLGWTAKDLAEKLDFTRQTISTITSRKYKMTRVQYLAILKIVEDEIKSFPDETYIASVLKTYVIEDDSWFSSSEERDVVMNLITAFAEAVGRNPNARSIMSNAFVSAMNYHGCTGFIE